MRPKDKIEKYIQMLAEKSEEPFELIESARSRYFKINEKVIRVSDHVGQTSSGAFSIIIQPRKPQEYILHTHTTGAITIASYLEVQTVIRAFFIMPALFYDLTSYNAASNFRADKNEISQLKAQINNLEQKCDTLATKIKMDTNMDVLFGCPIENLTENQITTLKKIIQSFNK